MKISKMIKDEKQISYETLKMIEEHAKKYDEAIDKKEFLGSIGAYEQKLILLNSRDPYEVLSYMEELDLPSTKLILEELTYDEVSKILELFTSEDKKRFYTTFGDLSLVNQFIKYDKNASDYIEELTLDRKVDLLNSSNSTTVLATSKVYESIPEELRDTVVQNITSAEASAALSSSSSYVEDSSISENNNVIPNEEESNLSNKEVNNIEKEQQVQLEENVKKQQLEELDLELKEKIEFFKSNLEKYKQTMPGLEESDVSDLDFYMSLSPELKSVIDSDFYAMKKQSLNQIEVKQDDTQIQVSNEYSSPKDLSVSSTENQYNSLSKMEYDSKKLKKFEQAKAACEIDVIEKIKNGIIKSSLELETAQLYDKMSKVR